MRRLFLLVPIFAAIFLLFFSPPPRADTPLPEETSYARVPGMEALLHWTRFPVRVFIATHGPDEQRQAQWAMAGFDEWVRAAGSAVRYQIVNAPGQAEIVVRFTQEASVPNERGAIGTTVVTYRRDTLKHAEMRLATGDATPEDVQSVAAHEFGHALGIQGHSDNPNDLMFPSATRYFAAPGVRLPDPPREVTRRDLNTLRACYPRLPVAAPLSP